MTPRRLIRWKSFWLGVLVLDFVGWVWWDSTRVDTAVSLARPPHVMKIASSEEGTYLTWGIQNPLLPSPPGLTIQREAHDRSADKMAWDYFERRVMTLGHSVLIPHDCAMAAAMSCWLGWLAWRSLRIKRLATARPIP